MVAPDISRRTDDMLAFWPEEDPASVFGIYNRQLSMEELMEAYVISLRGAVVPATNTSLSRPLVADQESHRKSMRLLRYREERDRRYRMVTTVNIDGQQDPDREYSVCSTLGSHDLTRFPLSVASVVEIDITSCTLNPVYASPAAKDAPFEMVLEVDRSSRGVRIVFVHREDLFKFQQALTGFKVVNGYAE